MGLGIYTDADPAAALTQSGIFTNPLAITLDGRRGGIWQKRLYVGNNDPDLYYSGIAIQPLDTAGDNVVDGSIGWTWKLNDGNEQPSDLDWEIVDPGEATTISGNIGGPFESDVSTYLPFWVRVEVPRNVRIQTLTDVVLRASAFEGLVT